VFGKFVCPSKWVRFEFTFCGWWGVGFAEETDVVVFGEGVFVEHRFGWSLGLS